VSVVLVLPVLLPVGTPPSATGYAGTGPVAYASSAMDPPVAGDAGVRSFDM
jgi:hypothetical protein